MANITITKTGDGKLAGFTDQDAKAYERFRSVVTKLEEGELIGFSFKLPRSRRFHNLHMAIFRAVYDNQEIYNTLDQVRDYVYMNANLVDFRPNVDGALVAVPRSINWLDMDDAEFGEHHEASIAALRTERVYRFLWPHVSARQAEQTIEAILAEFDA